MVNQAYPDASNIIGEAMKGYLIELRKKGDQRSVVSSGSVFAGATAERRRRMADRLYGKSPRGVYIVVEYDADWSDCVNPTMTEIARYEIGENPPETESGVDNDTKS